MGRHLKLDELLNTEYEGLYGDQIEVYTVWSSEIPTSKSAKQLCRFVFSDGENYMAAVLNFTDGDNSEARNVFRILQKKSCQFKLTNFQVQTNLGQPCWVLRGQLGHIILSSSTRDVTPFCSAAGGPQTIAIPSQQPFPFRFTALDQIDQCCSGQLVDVLVYTTEVSKTERNRNTGNTYKRMSVSSIRSKNPNKTGFERTITIFGDPVKERLSKNTVYALYNVMVDDEDDNVSNIKSLHTTGFSVILKIKNLEDLPRHCHQESFVLKLLPKKREKASHNGSGSGNPLPPKSVVPPSSSGSFAISSLPTTHSQFPPAISYSEKNRNFPIISIIGSSISNNLQIPPAEANRDIKVDPSILNVNGKRELSETSSDQNSKRFKLSPAYDSMDDASEDLEYDFIQNEETLKVRKETVRSTRFMDGGKDTYRMRSNFRGIALIINNFFFKLKSEKDGRYREGSHKDVEHLREILIIFKFDVIVRENVTSEQLPFVLEEFKAEATNKMDACFVAILSHGLHGFVEMVDGKLVPLSNGIIHQFDRKALSVFAGKPKIFLIQACKDLPTEEDCRQIVNHYRKKKDFDLENMIECYATTSGDSAKRDIILGSHFIYVFVDQLMKHAHDTDLVTILKRVQDKLANNIRWDENHKLHCEWKRHSFNKSLFFNPGL